MATQYSNLQFFRKTPNQYLAQYFQAKGIELGLNVSQLKENDTAPLQSALNQLADSQIAGVEADFQGVNTLACEGGVVALADEALFHNDEAFIDTIAAIEGFHAKAMWAFLNQPNYWRGAVLFLHADNVSPTYWKKRNDFQCLSPHVEEADIDALAKAISAYFFNKEGRDKKQRITLEADAHKYADAIYTLQNELNLPPYNVTQLGIKVTFDAVGGVRAKTRMFKITYPNSCALNHDGKDLKIRKMLASSGLELQALNAAEV